MTQRIDDKRLAEIAAHYRFLSSGEARIINQLLAENERLRAEVADLRGGSQAMADVIEARVIYPCADAETGGGR